MTGIKSVKGQKAKASAASSLREPTPTQEVCAICQKNTIVGDGHSAFPLREKGQCCDWCYSEVVYERMVRQARKDIQS
jgi:hypothetical protein